MFGRGECAAAGEDEFQISMCQIFELLLCHQVANHVVQALLNQKVNLGVGIWS